MARTSYAIRKLEAAGFDVRTYDRDSRIYGHKSAAGRGETISFIDQNGEAINFYVKADHMQDDIQTDYWAGTFVDNISQAIRMADDSLTRYAELRAAHADGTCHNWCGYCRDEHNAGQCTGACTYCANTARQIVASYRGDDS